MARRILVVEDNDLNRKLFCEVLRSQGFTVEPVADGSQALAQAQQFGPDLIIMDIQMPNVSGLDLIAAAKADATLCTVPVLAVTAYAGKGDEERIRGAGAEGYLAKPVSMRPFMAAVLALLNLSELKDRGDPDDPSSADAATATSATSARARWA